MTPRMKKVPVDLSGTVDILVLGIDPGTTSFKVAILEAQEITERQGNTYIHKDADEQVIPLSQFPGYERFDSVTVPTSLIYNENGQLIKWGHHAVNFQTDDRFDPKYLVEYWKIGLRTSSSPEGLRIRKILEGTAARLGKVSENFIEDFFTVVRRFVLENEKSPLLQHLGGVGRLRDFKYIDVVLALPPGWPRDEHRAFTTAARRGLGENHQLRVSTVSETECVLNQWITKPNYRKKIKVGDVVILLDLGGGTASISAFHLRGGPPENKKFGWEHIESHSLTAGSQIVTEAFIAEFHVRLNETGIPATAQLIHRVRKEFDEKKLSIGEESPERDWPIEVKGLTRDDSKGLGNDKMWFTGDRLLGFFEASQTQILEKLIEVVDRLRKGYSMPKFCVLAGAYGNNVIFKERLREIISTKKYDMDLQSPQYCGEAVVRGACLARVLGELGQASGSQYSVAVLEYRLSNVVKKKFPPAATIRFNGDKRDWSPVLAWKIKKGDAVQANHKINAQSNSTLRRYFDRNIEAEFTDTIYTSESHPGEGECTCLQHKISTPEEWKLNELDLLQRGIEGKAFDITWELRNVRVQESNGSWGSMHREALSIDRVNKIQYVEYKYHLAIGQIDVRFSIETFFKNGIKDIMELDHKPIVIMDEPESVILRQEYEHLPELGDLHALQCSEVDDPKAKRQRMINNTPTTQLLQEAEYNTVLPENCNKYSSKDTDRQDGPPSLQSTGARGQMTLATVARHSLRDPTCTTSSPSLNQDDQSLKSHLVQHLATSHANSLRRPRQEALTALRNPVVEPHKRDFWAVTDGQRSPKRIINPFR